MITGIQEYSQTEAALAVLATRYSGVLFDVGTSAGLTEAKMARADIKGYRVDLEKKRKELKAPTLDRCKLIDDEAKRITAALTALEDPIDSAIKAEEARKEAAKLAKEEAERVRAAIIAKKIVDITSYAIAAIGRTARKINDMIKSVEAMEIDSSFDDRFGEASLAKADTLSSLRKSFEAQVAADHREDALNAEREQLAREKRQHDEKVAAENAARALAVEAERKEAAQEAENLRRMAAEIKAAQAKLDDEVRHADLVKAEVERERARTRTLALEKAKAEAAAEAKRVADKAAEENNLIEGIWKESRRIEFNSVPYIEKAISAFKTIEKYWINDPRPRVASAVAEARKELNEKLSAAKAEAMNKFMQGESGPIDVGPLMDVHESMKEGFPVRSAAQFGAAVAAVKMNQAQRQNPGLNAILFTLSERYEVSTEVASGWLRELIGEKAA